MIVRQLNHSTNIYTQFKFPICYEINLVSCVTLRIEFVTLFDMPRYEFVHKLEDEIGVFISEERDFADKISMNCGINFALD